MPGFVLFVPASYYVSMVINAKDIHGLPVRTRAGTSVGKVGSVDIETNTGRIAVLGVKTGGFVTSLLGQELDIVWSQIVSLDQKEVVVEDAVVPAKDVARARAGNAVPSGVHLSEAEGTDV